MQKICFKCGRKKPAADFYRHAKMADGRLNKCKECTKADVRNNCAANRDHYVEYEAARAMSPDRVAARAAYQATRPETVVKAKRSWATRNPDKRKAHNLLNAAVKTGRVVHLPCEKCGSNKSQAHHEDYSKPLVVVWLCSGHHRERHIELKSLPAGRKPGTAKEKGT